MAISPKEEVRRYIMWHLEDYDDATWSEIVQDVAHKVHVSPMYVERALGDMVQSGVVKRKSTGGFPRYHMAKTR